MSVHYSSAVWKLKMSNSGRKLVALALADMSNDEGVCWPSLRHLSERCNMRIPAIRTHLDALESAGIVQRRGRFESGRQTSNLYQFCVLSELQGGG